MSRSRIIILALPFACLANGLAQREAVIDELLRPILTACAADPNVEAWNWEKNRNGGYLLRKSMDVTGDGRPEIFIASTLHSDRSGHSWNVFDVADDGTKRPYEGSFRFGYALPVTDSGERYLIKTVFDKERFRGGDEEQPYRLIRYLFTFPEISETTTYVSEDGAVKLQPADPGELPKLQAMLLADYLTNPDAKWSDVTELKLDASDSYYLEEDKERAEKNTAFTPQVALSQLGMGQPTSKGSEDQTGAHHSEQGIPPFIPQQSAPRKPTDKKPATSPPFEEPSSSTRWLVLAAVIVAARGLLWVLLKMRK